VPEKEGKINWKKRVENKNVLLRGKEERNSIYTIKERKSNWIGHITWELPSKTHYCRER